MNVVAYCRVSTDGQAQDDKFGIDNQKAIITEYAVKHDMTISQWYVDEGESGVKESRPAMNALLFGDIVANPPVEAVVVAKSDRIARDIKLYFYYMMVLERKNIKLISATEEVVNDDTGLGNVYKSLMLFVAEQERKNITMRTSGGRVIKAQAGGYSGGRPPYGYKTVDGKLEVIPEEAEAIRLMFKMKDSGDTYQQIVDEMNRRGLKTHVGIEMRISTIQVILGNRKLYQGYYKYKSAGGEWIKGQHEAILTEE